MAEGLKSVHFPNSKLPFGALEGGLKVVCAASVELHVLVLDLRLDTRVVVVEDLRNPIPEGLASSPKLTAESEDVIMHIVLSKVSYEQ